MSAPASRRGFTLVELLVAMTVTVIAVSLAWRILVAVTAGTSAAADAREKLDRQVNAHRWLARTFGSLEIGEPGTPGFTGLEDRVAFTAWLETPMGWLETKSVAIAVEEDVLVARAGGERVALMGNVVAVELDYLLEPGGESRWAHRWSSPTSAPLAIRLRIGRAGDDHRSAIINVRPPIVDTLLYLIGERG